MTSVNANDNVSGESNTEIQQISSSTIKIPPFWTNNPEIWFIQVEAQFLLTKIKNDRIKYNYILASLPLDVITKVYDVIENPPNENIYDNFKQKLIGRLTASEEQRLNTLLSNSELGDKKPSEFYREMSTTVGGSNTVSPELLLKLWKRKLPKSILVAITVSNKTQINDILEIADKIWETYKDDNISMVNQPSCSMKQDNQIIPQLLQSFNDLTIKCKDTLEAISNKNQYLEKKMQDSFDTLQTQISMLQNRGRSINRQNFNYRGRSSSRNRHDSRNRKDLCFYHDKYKDKATKCEGPWCKFLSKNLN